VTHSSRVTYAHNPKVDKLEQMLGSYGPHPKSEAYVKNFDPDESPSGMLARSGVCKVRSRVVDDDGEVYAGAYRPSSIPTGLQRTPHYPHQIGTGASSSRKNGKTQEANWLCELQFHSPLGFQLPTVHRCWIGVLSTVSFSLLDASRLNKC
jgi:hypothetical protein